MSDSAEPERPPILFRILEFMPLFFAFGFVVPVIAQGIGRIGLVLPFGVSPLVPALLVGGSWGLFAQFRGRWL